MDLLREKLRAFGHHRAQVAAAMIGSAVVGGVMSSQASKSAANTQADAANNATQAQKDMFDKTVQLEAPYNMAGVGAQNKLSYLLGISPTGYWSSAPGATIGPNGVVGPSNAGSAASGTMTVPVMQAGGPASEPATTETEAQIRQRLAPQFASKLSDAYDGSQMNADLNAAVQQEMQRQAASAAQHQAPQSPAAQITGQGVMGPGGQAMPGSAAASDPAYGSLLHNFDLSDFQMDPGIRFQTQQGNLALQNSQAAKDGVMSGAALKDLIAYNQGMAGTGYQSAYDRYMANKQFTLGSLMGVSQLGQAAAGNTVNNAGGFSSGIAGTIQGAGNAQAAGTVGSANAISGALTSSSNAYLLRNLMNPGGNSGGGSTFTTDPTMPYVTGTGSLGD